MKLDVMKNYFNNNNKNDKCDDYYQTIEKKDFFLQNKLQVMKKMRKIINYCNKFESIIDVDLVKIGANDELVEIDKNYIITYNFDKNTPILDFHDYLFSLISIKKFVSEIIMNYKTLLYNIFDLYNNNICFFNLNPENIIFYKGRIILINFTNSFLINNSKPVDFNHFKAIVLKKENLVYYPIEIHLLYHMFEKQTNILNYQLIQTVCNSFISQLTVLEFFDPLYKEKYNEICFVMLEKYLNKTPEFIYNDFYKFSDTWDNYSLSITFIHLIGCFIEFSKCKETYFNNWLSLLSKTIHPSPSRRVKINYCVEQLDIISEKYKDWDFIEKIDKIPIKQLFEII